MAKIQCVIFDFDGVVADTETVFSHFDCRLLNDVLGRANIEDTLRVADIRALAGNSAERKLELVAERLSIDLSPYEEEFIEIRTKERKTLFRDHPVPLGKNLKKFLGLLDNRYGLATNKLEAKLFPDMALIGVLDLFPVLVTSDAPMCKKPAPDMLLQAASELEVAPESCAYVGDNVLDMQAAVNAGMMPIGFIIEGKKGYEQRAGELLENGAHDVIDDFMSLEPYLESL